MARPTVLIISSVDPSGGAGMLADLRAVAACECRPMAVVVALTAQNDQRVNGVFPQSGEVVRAQIDSAAAAGQIDAVKIGLLPSAEIVSVVAAALRSHRFPHVVIDPVFQSSSGYALVNDGVPRAMQEDLFPLGEVLTPNLGEAARLLGRPIDSLAAVQAAAGELLRSGMKSVVIKGGHLPDSADDLYADAERSEVLHAQRIEGTGRRGTGCTFASALASALARGLQRVDAVRFAKEYTRVFIERGD